MKIVTVKDTCVYGRWPVRIPINDISNSHMFHVSCVIPGRDGRFLDQMTQLAGRDWAARTSLDVRDHTLATWSWAGW